MAPRHGVHVTNLSRRKRPGPFAHVIRLESLLFAFVAIIWTIGAGNGTVLDRFLIGCALFAVLHVGTNAIRVVRRRREPRS